MPMESAPAPTRLAATVLLLRDADPSMEVFMVVRHHEIEFASGALVFPGGRVDDDDHRIAANPMLFPADHGLDPEQAALRVAAIRETFEETGILLTKSRGADELVNAAQLMELESKRAALNAGSLRFVEFLTAESLILVPDRLVRFAHWITPDTMRKRFDTHFFMAMAPPGQLAAHDGSEAVDSIWIAPGKAIEDSTTGRFKLLFPTEMNLGKLARHRRAADALAVAASSRVVAVQPVILKDVNGVRSMRIPAEADYGGEIFQANNPLAL